MMKSPDWRALPLRVHFYYFMRRKPKERNTKMLWKCNMFVATQNGNKKYVLFFCYIEVFPILEPGTNNRTESRRPEASHCATLKLTPLAVTEWLSWFRFSEHISELSILPHCVSFLHHAARQLCGKYWSTEGNRTGPKEQVLINLTLDIALRHCFWDTSFRIPPSREGSSIYFIPFRRISVRSYVAVCFDSILPCFFIFFSHSNSF
jgi:hypothetical protein